MIPIFRTIKSRLTVVLAGLLIPCVIVFFLLSGETTAESTQKVYVISVSGTVEPGMAAFIKRALNDIPQDPNNLIVFELDSFGGRVDSAYEIVDTISDAPQGKTVAYVTKKAISAGSLIALSCNLLIMKNNTTIGDCAPIIYSNEGPKMMGEKFQSPLRAKFRALARKNNYPVALAESMVTLDMEVYRIVINGETRYIDAGEYEDLSEKEKKKIKSKKTIVAKGELLTMDDVEAEEFGFSKSSVDTLKDALAVLGYENADIIKIQENWSEDFVRFIQPFLPILMLIGMGALYTEIKAPGFGLPGIIGIVCLGLVFFNQYLVGLADHTELLIVLIGIGLLGFEVFVLPGFGIAGVTGLAIIAAGLVLSLQDFVIPDPTLPWESELLMKNLAQVLASLILALLSALFMLRFVLPRVSKVINGPYLDASLEESHADSTEALAVNPGDFGTAVTFLRPSGKIRIRGKKVDAITQGEFLEKGTPVTITEIHGNRVIVQKKE